MVEPGGVIGNTQHVTTIKSVSIYTDGACTGNPGPGGYGTILDYKGQRREMSEGYRLTTNNRMELLAVIKGLGALKEPCNVTVFSDSTYVVQAMTAGWVDSWQRRGWRKADKGPVLNVDLWQQMIELCKAHSVKFEWVRGHNGHPENERCDVLAVAAAHGLDLLIDSGYHGEAASGAAMAAKMPGLNLPGE